MMRVKEMLRAIGENAIRVVSESFLENKKTTELVAKLLEEVRVLRADHGKHLTLLQTYGGALGDATAIVGPSKVHKGVSTISLITRNDGLMFIQAVVTGHRTPFGWSEEAGWIQVGLPGVTGWRRDDAGQLLKAYSELIRARAVDFPEVSFKKEDPDGDALLPQPMQESNG